MYDLNERLLKFSIEVIKILRKVPNTLDQVVLKKQLIRSSTSVGANYEEAQGAASIPDFNYKIRISLKEMRESNYWLKILKAVTDNPSLDPDFNFLINESNELKSILGAIIRKSEKKL